jgi:hypothetical protein
MRTLGLAPVNSIEDTFSISYSWRQFLHMGGIENTHYSSPSYMANTSLFPGSIRTVRRRLRASELRNRASARKIGLTSRHKEAIGFALEHLAREEAFWISVVFFDEKVFQSCPNGRLRVYRPRNSAYDERYVQTTQRSGRFSVNMWAWISADSPGSWDNATCRKSVNQ